MVKHAEQVIVVADSSKLGMISTIQVCPPGRVDVVITDDGAEPATVEAFREARIRVVMV
jgi:DeoR family transcriptional regulator of aga operon